MNPQMDALCACCEAPMRATTFPAVCAECQREGARLGVQGYRIAILSANSTGDFPDLLRQPPDPWLALLTVGDARFLHEMKIDPLG